MSRYIMIHRLRGPSVLLLIGVLALLHTTGLLPHFWRLFWPLLFILLGVLMLAERAALASEGYPIFSGWPWHAPAQSPPDSGETWHSGWQEASPSAEHSSQTAIVPSQPSELANRGNGEQS